MLDSSSIHVPSGIIIILSAATASRRPGTTGRAKKIIPWEKFDISGIVADFFAKFTAYIEED